MYSFTTACGLLVSYLSFLPYTRAIIAPLILCHTLNYPADARLITKEEIDGK